jgi:dihydroorotase
MTAAKRTLIENARLIDPETGMDERGGILFDTHEIRDVGPHVTARSAPSASDIIDGEGLTLIPGVIDVRVAIGEPGAEHRETLRSTDPVIDDASLVDFIRRRAPERTKVRVLTAAALTRGLAGKDIAEIGLLSEAGAAYFSNGDAPLMDSRLLRRALSYATAFKALIAHRPEDPWLADGASVTEGELALRLGLGGQPAAGVCSST